MWGSACSLKVVSQETDGLLSQLPEKVKFLGRMLFPQSMPCQMQRAICLKSFSNVHFSLLNWLLPSLQGAVIEEGVGGKALLHSRLLSFNLFLLKRVKVVALNTSNSVPTVTRVCGQKGGTSRQWCAL